jgi:hypothetical protein
MHTDYTSVQNLQNLIKAIYPQYVCLLRLPKRIQQQVYPMLVDPSNIGCGYLKNMMLHPDEYQTPANLTGAFIKAYFDYMWNHEDWSKLNWFMEDYEVLLGNHTESAVINILPIFPPTGKCAGKLPLIAPTSNSYSFFINHPESVGPFRDQLAAFFAPKINMPASQFRSALDILGYHQTNTTVTYLAGDKSIFYVTINVTEAPGPGTNTTNTTSTGTPSFNATSTTSDAFQTTGTTGTGTTGTTGTTGMPATTGTTGTTAGTTGTPATTGARATTGTTGTTGSSGASISTTGLSQSSGGSSAGPVMVILALLIVVVGGTAIVYFVNRYGFNNLVNKVKTTLGFHTTSTVSRPTQPKRAPQPSFLEMNVKEESKPHTPVPLDEV